MVNGVGWDLLNNGTMISAAFEVYNGSAAFNGYMLGMLYILFQSMLWYKVKKPLPGIVIGVMFLSIMFSYNLASGYGFFNPESVYITTSFMGIIATTLIIQFAGWVVSLWFK